MYTKVYKYLLFLLILFSKGLSVCHEGGLSIQNKLDTNQHLNDIGCINSYNNYFFTISSSSKSLQKRDLQTLNVLSQVGINYSDSKLICLGQYIAVYWKTNQYFNVLLFDEYLTKRATYTGKGDSIAYDGNYVYISYIDNIIVLDIGLRDVDMIYVRENIKKIQSIDDTIVIFTYDSIYTIVGRKASYVQDLPRGVDFGTVKMANYDRLFWLNFQILLSENSTRSVFDVDLSELPFQYSYEQTSNFLDTDTNYLYISMKSSNYGITDHNYFLRVRQNSVGYFQLYSHCTFHDTNGGVKAFSIQYPYLILYHNPYPQEAQINLLKFN